MKKLIATIISLTILAMMALPAAAQTRSRINDRTYYGNRYDGRYDRRSERRAQRVNRTNVYYDENYDYEYGRDRSVWEKHRDKITTAGGAAGGAVIGGLIGGRKGAIIGAITGGAGAAIYTYKIRDKNRRY
jgi:hypothetical protein